MDTIYGIDIGSNSVRLAKISGGRTVYKLAEITQVSEGLGASGFLAKEAMERTLFAVLKFVGIAKKEGATPFIYATEAFRSAANGREFAGRISSECKIHVDIISSAEEACLGYIGAGGFDKKRLTVIDIGGASTEIVCGRGRDITFIKSVSVGVVSLKDSCGNDLSALNAFIDKKLKQYGKTEPAVCACGIGGTATSLAAIDLKLEKYDPQKVNGHIIDINRLKDTANMLLSMDVDEISKLPGVQEKRAEVIAGGAFLMYKVMRLLGCRRLRVSESDNLEGYAIKQITGKNRSSLT